jgi:hypothetical protein
MTRLLDAALAEVAKLPPDEQDALAALMLHEIRSEQHWRASFARSQHALKTMADEALAEFDTGKVKRGENTDP